MSGRIGPNQQCDCGSGKKFKKCCGARGRITDPVQAEQQAHNEERWREQRKKPKSKDAALIPFLFAGMLGADLSGPGPAPPKPKRRNRRKPQ
jgi:hypothetical protein